jgi:hypothetical protein
MLDCVYGWKVLESNKILGFIVGSWDLGLKILSLDRDDLSRWMRHHIGKKRL